MLKKCAKDGIIFHGCAKKCAKDGIIFDGCVKKCAKEGIIFDGRAKQGIGSIIVNRSWIYNR